MPRSPSRIHVGDVEAADLVDALGDLEEPVVHVETGLAPQARIHGRRRLGVLEKGVVAKAPHDPAVRVLDLDLGQRGQEAAAGVVEVLGVVERQRAQHGAVERVREGGGVLRTVGGSGHDSGLFTSQAAGGLDGW